MTTPRLVRIERLLGIAAAVQMGLTFVLGLGFSPPERVLGRMAAILYVHAGAAWTAYLAFGITALASMLFLWRRRGVWDRLAVAGAEAGWVLATVALVTGSIWAKGAQGWWWRWDDPRLVLTLFLWFLYAGYLTLRQFTEGERRARLSAVLALMGIPTMVLNHFAILIWGQRFHPAPVIVRPEAPAASPVFLWLLGLSLVAYSLLLAWAILARMRLEALRESLDEAAG